MRRARNAGFVLVEALTTLTITALLMASLVTLVGFLMTAGDKASNNLQSVEITSRTFATLDRDIRGASRIRWGGEDRSFFIFNGLKDRILFVREEPDDSGLLQSWAIAYQTIPRDGGTRLVRAVAKLPPGALDLSELEFGPQTQVYSGPAEFRFAFYGATEDGTSETLTDNWAEANQMPNAVRISLANIKTGELVDQIRIPFQVDAEPGCAAPGSGGYCSLVESKVNRADQNKTDGGGGDGR